MPSIENSLKYEAEVGGTRRPAEPVSCGSPGGFALPVVGSILSIAKAMLDAARFYHDRGRWFLHLFLLMPDHLHMLASFPSKSVKETCGAWKGFLRKTTGVRFQPDCFEHRIRNAAEFTEKWHYIRNNPLRKGLATLADSWPYWLAFDPRTGNQSGGARRPAEPQEQSSGSPGGFAPPLV